MTKKNETTGAVSFWRKIKEPLMKYVFLAAACVSILAVALICLFLFSNGIPAIAKIGPFNFLLGQKWKPGNNIYGIFPMIVGSIYVTAGAILTGVPVGFLTAVYLAKFCPEKIYKVFKPMIDLLAGIPSVVYGFFGMVVIVPFVRQVFGGKRKQYPDSFSSFGNDDPADHHQCLGGGDPCRAGKLL